MAWITGLLGSLFGLALGLFGTLWAAKNGPFNNRFLIFAGLLPVVGFMYGFKQVARMRGQWPVPRLAPRLALALTCAVLGAVGMYLSFVTLSSTWNHDTLPPEKQSLVYLIFHPSEVPPVAFQNNPKSYYRPSTWPLSTILTSCLAGFAGYMWSRRGDG